MQNDMPRFSDIAGALRLLTRLPLPADHTAPRAGAAWAWPLAGVVVGGIAAGLGLFALPLGPAVAAALVLAAQAMLTGAMHEDGLADTADGLWGGWDRAKRLAIMKDSHIGTYGVMALLLVTLVRWDALIGLLVGEFWVPIVAVAAMSRAPMAVIMVLLPNARGTGLSQSVGRPVMLPASIGVGIALLLGIFAFGFGVLVVAMPMVAVCGLLALVARAKIGGQTGDILGASQQLAEAVGLTMAAYLLVEWGG